MEKYIIISILDSFQFPLREAIEKQIWWTAEKRRDEGFDVSIILLTNCEKKIEQDGVKIFFKNKKHILKNKLSGDYVHFINNVVSLGLLIVVLSRGHKTLTLTDGYIWGQSRETLRKAISKVLPLIFNEIQVYSNYQKKMLKIESSEIVQPILPDIKGAGQHKRCLEPTMLYMGHLSYFKGVDVIVEAFKKLVVDFENLKWVIANNMVRGDEDLITKIKQLKEEYPENIVIKGVIDPIKELSEAWVYVYPFSEPGGTMAYPLSLYESLMCDTPFVACNVGANSEFFDEKHLIKPNDHRQMYSRIKAILNERIH
ncbi:MAG: glycosyltransferase family 4 protein [Planctomycetes bacterium]|nr:glycosyltransferase family 4 protein [Planctomycetota bacterium]